MEARELRPVTTKREPLAGDSCPSTPLSTLTRRALTPRQARRPWKVSVRGQHLVTSVVLAQVGGTVGEQGDLQREEKPQSGSDGSTARIFFALLITSLYLSQLELRGDIEILLLSPEFVFYQHKCNF